MKELSLNVLDITKNSTKAGATLIVIHIIESDERLVISIKDNGRGMDEETVRTVTDPFYTTRTTRKVGMGIPLFKLAAEQTGGYIDIKSVTKESNAVSHGTEVTATFNKKHIDFTPLGDIISTVQLLVQGDPDVDFVYIHEKNSSRVELDTRDLREILEDVPLDSFEVIGWIGDNLKEQYDSF